jgi:hypothetical protein
METFFWFTVTSAVEEGGAPERRGGDNISELAHTFTKDPVKIKLKNKRNGARCIRTTTSTSVVRGKCEDNKESENDQSGLHFFDGDGPTVCGPDRSNEGGPIAKSSELLGTAPCGVPHPL